jgi:hypothetical protein
MASTRYLSDVRFWPKADIHSCTAHVRFRGQSGHLSSRPAIYHVLSHDGSAMGYNARNDEIRDNVTREGGTA